MHQSQNREIFLSFSFAIFAMTSLLCLASFIHPIGIASSTERRDEYAKTFGHHDAGVTINDGVIYWFEGSKYMVSGLGSSYSDHHRWTYHDVANLNHGLEDTTLGFSAPHTKVIGRPVYWTQYSFPFWVLAGLLAIRQFMRIRRIDQIENAKRQGLCESCGYDLRATTDRCPECGMAVRQ